MAGHGPYVLRADPYEMTNPVDLPDHAQVRRELGVKLIQHMKANETTTLSMGQFMAYTPGATQLWHALELKLNDAM